MTNEEFNAKTDELWAATKRGELPRDARFEAIERLTDEYIAATGKRPEPAQLDRLATLCLYEEVTDPHPDKMARDKYPIMSDTQREERITDEVGFGATWSHGIDGRDHRMPKRRFNHI